MEADVVNSLGGSAAPDAAEITLWYLFQRADIVVKAVMLLLVVASIWCWAVIFDKVMTIRAVRRRSDKFEDAFWSGGPLDDLYDRVSANPADPMAAVFSAGMREWRRSAETGPIPAGAIGLQQRIERVMSITLEREMGRLEKYLTLLASVGSAAPFIGLFGTVWGIMNAFTAIAASKQTSLAVVAPGIAEALFATALGLVAAIPATVAYNKFSNDMARYAGRLEGFMGEFSTIVSRQLDEGA